MNQKEKDALEIITRCLDNRREVLANKEFHITTFEPTMMESEIYNDTVKERRQIEGIQQAFDLNDLKVVDNLSTGLEDVVELPVYEHPDFEKDTISVINDQEVPTDVYADWHQHPGCITEEIFEEEMGK